MKSITRWTVAVVVATSVAAFASAGLAQGGGQFQPSPQMMAKFKAWQTWRDNHKHVAQVGQTVRALREIEKNSTTKLTPAQAKRIVPVLKAWRNKPVMTDDQALQVNKQITGVLNESQLKTLASIPDFGRGGRGFGGGARPGGGGQGGQGGARPGGFDPSKMPDPHDFNPLNPDTNPMAKMNPQMSSQMRAGFDQLIADLSARAK